METDKVENSTEVNDSKTAVIKIKEKKQSLIADVATLDIKSRLSLETTELSSEPHVNGIAQVNGICDSPQRIADATVSPQSETMETSHLNQHGM